MISFGYLTQAQYDALETKVTDRIYYVNDTRCIMLNSVRYGADTLIVVSSFPETGLVGKVYVHETTLEHKIYSNSAWVSVVSPQTTTVSSSSTDSQLPTAKAVYTFVLNQLAGVDFPVLPPVQDITALKALTTMVDKDMVLVEDKGALYRYDADSTATADDDGVVTPTAGTGRWIKMITAVSYTAGDGIDITSNVISLNIDSDIFEFSTGVLTLKSTVLSGKMDKVATAVEDNLASFDANGQVQDSGVAAGGATFAATPDSVTLATEAAVADALSFK